MEVRPRKAIFLVRQGVLRCEQFVRPAVNASRSSKPLSVASCPAWCGPSSNGGFTKVGSKHRDTNEPARPTCCRRAGTASGNHPDGLGSLPRAGGQDPAEVRVWMEGGHNPYAPRTIGPVTRLGLCLSPVGPARRGRRGPCLAQPCTSVAGRGPVIPENVSMFSFQDAV